MQNKGAIKLVAITLALVCIYQLWFSFETYWVRQDAVKFAKGDKLKEQRYLDSLSGKSVFNFLFVKEYTYKECLDREIPLGLDLKGGMNVTLEISVVDLVKALSNYSKDPTFNKALALAKEKQKSSQSDFVTLFGQAFTQVDPGAKLASVFSTRELRTKIKSSSTNEEVLTVIHQETDDAIDNAFNILRNRIDRFGVTQPNIQRLQTRGRILIELPGAKEPERVRKLLQGSANLEFWETYDNTEILPLLVEANKKLKGYLSLKMDTVKKDSLTTMVVKKDSLKADTSNLLAKIKKDTTGTNKNNQSLEQFQKENPLFGYMTPATSQDGRAAKGATIGTSHHKDTARVNTYLNLPQIRQIFPRDLRLVWEYKAVDIKQAGNFFQLVALKANREGRPSLTGDVITDAREQFGQNKASAEVSMTMDGEGAKIWAKLTKQNIGKQIAIVLDNSVYSAPVVQNEINGGSSQITGNFSITEAKDLANTLKSGKMPAPAHIIQEEVVGPSLGQEAINSGLLSFILAFIGVLAYMWLYYARAGGVANIALIANTFFQFGVLASLQAVLTLPGIAGVVLTLAMAVDSNVIIYERMREEIRVGKGMGMVIKDGFWHAYSAIIDGHVTTILTGIVLYVFGSGPVQGFATTLIIGLVLSLFSSIFIARLVFEAMLKKNMNITVGNKYTNNAFTKTKIDFIGIRKLMYVISGVIMLIGVISLFVRGMSYGVDFTGGRTYVVRFDQDVNTQEVRNALVLTLEEAPEVKTFGPNNQVKITTKHMIKENSTSADSIVEVKVFNGLKSFFKTPITYTQFTVLDEHKAVGKLSSQKVGPSVASDMVYQAFMAVFFGLLIIFVYITLRFRNWQYGLGGVISLAHDSMVVITMFSLFHGILPFSLEVDQSFIAAILTVIGYSIMDSVIIFDRIREYTGLHHSWTLKDNINAAINSTLGRTINTSGITLVVLIVIFIFGGEVLRGFIFALLVGVAVGTYSSVFNATPIAYDVIVWMEKRKENKKLALNKAKK